MKNKRKTFFISFAFIFLILALFLEVFAFPPKRLPPKRRPIVKRRFIPAPIPKRPLRPGPKYIWIPRYQLPSGVYIGGSWRPPCGENFIWSGGYRNAKGEWVFGYCKPVHVRDGYVWVSGYRDGTGWTEGYWRPVKNPGFIWAPGHFNDNGIWIKGHWKKL